MTEDINVANRELTKEILDGLGITEFLKKTHLQPVGSRVANPDMAIEKYTQYFKKLYMVISRPVDS